MWSPTHIQVTVQRAKGLLTKGKNGTNNCFVTIALGKEKYQTSVKEKAETNVNWNEECELKIPDQGNRAELVLTCLHRNNLAIDEFLGQVSLPLNEMDVYDRPRSKWFKLESKPGKEKKSKERGELEARFTFVVKSGSLTDLSKKDKHKSSIGQLASSVGGSLLSIGTIEKRKGIKKFAKSIGSKMHLHSKKKNKDGDDVSFSGSFASIGTPNSSNGGSRRYGQRAGEADPGVISEDEDEFVFDNLSHKSSASSLNIRNGLQPPTQNFVPRNPSPLLGINGKAGGKQLPNKDSEKDVVLDPELDEIENDFNVRARTLPPPSKPPRTPQLEIDTTDKEKEQSLNEWETKLYGKHLEIGSSDSLKRRSWEQTRVPLPIASESTDLEAKNGMVGKEEVKVIVEQPNAINKRESFDNLNIDSSSSSSSESDKEDNSPELITEKIQLETSQDESKKILEPKLDTSSKTSPRISLLSPDVEKKDFNQLNTSFAKFEQRNSAKIFDLEPENIWKSSQAFISKESHAPIMPQPSPRNRDQEVFLRKAEEEEKMRLAEAEIEFKAQQEQQFRAVEDARLERELLKNEQRLHDEERALQEELRQQEEQKRREAKRREEDQRILNFAKPSTSVEEDQSYATPEQSPMEQPADKRERRLGKYKYFSKRDKNEDDGSSASPKSSERIIIGHEKATTHAERRSEISAALTKKYEGKSREELMLIANGMENEALIQRQRVKELEDYLDNLLLRVMETHPKILQNPYSRTTSAKSFKNYINMNDFL